MALPFLPANEIEQANEEIDSIYNAPDEFIEYFRNQWLPLRPMISLVENVAIRTNNVMEGFNSYLARNFKVHMNIWLFLAKFRNEEAVSFIKYQQVEFGAEITVQRF